MVPIDLAQGLTVEALLTLAGNAVVVAIVVELAKRTLALDPATVDRFGALLACATGTILAVLAAIFLSRDPVQAALTGFLAGALSAGLYDVAAERIGAVFTRLVTLVKPTGGAG